MKGPVRRSRRAPPKKRRPSRANREPPTPPGPRRTATSHPRGPHLPRFPRPNRPRGLRPAAVHLASGVRGPGRDHARVEHPADTPVWPSAPAPSEPAEPYTWSPESSTPSGSPSGNPSPRHQTPGWEPIEPLEPLDPSAAPRRTRSPVPEDPSLPRHQDVPAAPESPRRTRPTRTPRDSTGCRVPRPLRSGPPIPCRAPHHRRIPAGRATRSRPSRRARTDRRPHWPVPGLRVRPAHGLRGLLLGSATVGARLRHGSTSPSGGFQGSASHGGQAPMPGTPTRAPQGSEPYGGGAQAGTLTRAPRGASPTAAFSGRQGSQGGQGGPRLARATGPGRSARRAYGGSSQQPSPMGGGDPAYPSYRPRGLRRRIRCRPRPGAPCIRAARHTRRDRAISPDEGRAEASAPPRSCSESSASCCSSSAASAS